MQTEQDMKNYFHRVYGLEKINQYMIKIDKNADIIPNNQFIKQLVLFGEKIDKKCMSYQNVYSIVEKWSDDEKECRFVLLKKLLTYLSKIPDDRPPLFTTYFSDLLNGYPNVMLPTNLVRLTQEDLHKLTQNELLDELENQNIFTRDLDNEKLLYIHLLLSKFSSGSFNTKYTKPLYDLLIFKECKIDRVKIRTISHPFGIIDIILSAKDIENELTKENIVSQISKFGYGPNFQGTEDKKELSKLLIHILQTGTFVRDIDDSLRNMIALKLYTDRLDLNSINGYQASYDIDIIKSLIGI